MSVDRVYAAGDVWQTIQEEADKLPPGRLKDRIESWQTYPGYAREGDDDVEVVVLGNYNNPYQKPDTRAGEFEYTEAGYIIKKVQDIISAMYKVEFEWEDEWTNCQECNRVVRTSADSWGWEAYFVILRDSELYCIDCVKKSRDLLEDTVAECRNSSKKGMKKFWGIDVSGFGYRKVLGTDFEAGLHPGQNDNPRAILSAMRGKGFYCLFEIDDVRQFDMDFSLYIAREDESPVTDEDIKRVQEIMSKKENRELPKEGKKDGTGNKSGKDSSQDGSGCSSSPGVYSP